MAVSYGSPAPNRTSVCGGPPPLRSTIWPIRLEARSLSTRLHQTTRNPGADATSLLPKGANRHWLASWRTTMSNLGQLLQYLQHLNTAIKHPTDREDLSRLWNARERVRQAIDGITRPRGFGSAQ